MLCPKCGANNPDNANLCCICGEKLKDGVPQPQRPTKFCVSCGNTIDAQAVICPKCGVGQPNAQANAVAVNDNGGTGW